MKEVRVWKKLFEADLESIAIELTDSIAMPAVVIFSGPVGAGKTTFIKRILTSEGGMSPTYSIINEVGSVLHADFFRIKESSEVVHLELPMYLEDKDLFLIEWGMDFLREIKREVGDEFTYYRLDIQVGQDGPKENDAFSRNMTLFELD